jgi:uncharacterized membrane protein YqjE
MFKQLFRLATREPEILADHVEAYSGLIAGELNTAAGRWQRHAALRVLGYASFIVSGLLIAMGVMLWAVVPITTMNKPWVLAIVPLVPAAIGLWASSSARTAVGSETFSTLRRQWAADREMLREVSET